MKKPASKFELIDLTAITRKPHVARTIVSIYDDYRPHEWLVFGAAQFNHMEKMHMWSLNARMAAGITDFEHDSAYALKLPLIGLEFEGVLYDHYVRFNAFIAPDALDDFCVPTSSAYNPTTLPGGGPCTTCKGKDKHLLVPDGYFVPPRDPALYELVRGKRVEISLVTMDPKEDE